MRIFAALTIALALAAAPTLFGQQPPKIKRVDATYTNPGSGAEMFHAYCAVCHGDNGKGGGPAATALKTAPADLTALSAKHNGKFPALEVQQFIQGENGPSAHGTRDMPMWGDVFKTLSAEKEVTLIRVKNLSDYIAGLQR
jgi:mono/diheme cytochrome c family protein